MSLRSGDLISNRFQHLRAPTEELKNTMNFTQGNDFRELSVFVGYVFGPGGESSRSS